jgi:hypothetical protein
MNQENQPLTKKCPFCAEENLADAIKCKYCGELLNKQAAQSAGQQFSNAQPVWHFVLLTIVTFGIYEIYWFYRNWKHLKFHKDLDISPGWRTVGLFVPIYGIVLAYRQLRDIRDFSKEAGVDKTYSPGWILFGWLILSALCKLPEPFWLLSFLSVWPLAVVQEVLNSYWEKEQPELPIRIKFSDGEIALLVIGAIILVLALIGTFIPK